jgi:hypothetical protein
MPGKACHDAAASQQVPNWGGALPERQQKGYGGSIASIPRQYMPVIRGGLGDFTGSLANILICDITAKVHTP